MVKINWKAIEKMADKGADVGEKAVRAANKPFDVAAGGIAGAGKFVGKHGRFTKKTDPGIQNLWTGRREGAGAIIAGGAAGAAYMGYTGANQTVLAPRTGEISYSGAMPVMNADGVSSTSQAPTLGAGGNMVFGLHNARKG